MTPENIQQAIEALDKLTEQDATATESQLYSWRRAKDALKRAARRVIKIAYCSAGFIRDRSTTEVSESA